MKDVLFILVNKPWNVPFENFELKSFVPFNDRSEGFL